MIVTSPMISKDDITGSNIPALNRFSITIGMAITKGSCDSKNVRPNAARVRMVTASIFCTMFLIVSLTDLAMIVKITLILFKMDSPLLLVLRS